MNELQNIIDELKPELVPLLQQLINFQSITPPSNTQNIATFIKNYLTQNNIQLEILNTEKEGVVNCFTRLGKNRKKNSIGMHSHLDVVECGDKEFWDVQPFSGDIIDGDIWGRGAIDMKGFLAVQVLTLIAITKMKEDFQSDLIFIATADEEAGGAYATRKLINQKKADLDTLRWLISEGGCVYNCNNRNSSLIGFTERISRPVNVRISNKNGGGHAALETISESNISYLIPKIFNRIKIYNDNQHEYQKWPEKWPIDSTLTDSYFLRNSFCNTIVPTIIRTGIKRNVVPNILDISCDCRLSVLSDYNEFDSDLTKMFSFNGFTTNIETVTNSAFEHNKLVHEFDTEDETFLQLIKNTTQTPAYFISLPFMTDLFHFRLNGIKCFGFSPFIFSDKDIKLFHNFNERINVVQLLDGFERFVKLIFNSMQNKL